MKSLPRLLLPLRSGWWTGWQHYGWAHSFQTWEPGGVGERLHSRKPLGSDLPPFLSPLQCTQEDVSSEDEDEEMPEVGLPSEAALAENSISSFEHPQCTELQGSPSLFGSMVRAFGPWTGGSWV